MMIGLLPALARAQSGTDVSAAIPVHPDVPTILELPDAITRVWSIDRGELMVQGVGNQVYVRPRPDTPAGVEALVEVETATMHRIFLVRVVARAADAKREVVVPAAAAVCEPDTSRARVSIAPAPAEPTANSLPSPVLERAETEPTESEPPSAPGDERATPAAVPPRFDLSAHAVAGLGFTALNIAGYVPETALQLQNTFGLRLEGAPGGHWLSLEAGVSGELPAGPMRFERGRTSQLEVSGARLRAEVGVRAGRGRKWHPSVRAAIGLQAHLRRTVETFTSGDPETVSTMPRGAVLAVGLGLQYRARLISMGLDFEVRQGGPDDYFSVTAFLTLGRLLDQGE